MGFVADCPICREPIPEDDEEFLKTIRRHVQDENPAAIVYLGSRYEHGNLGLVKSYNEGLLRVLRCVHVAPQAQPHPAASHAL